MRVKLRGRDQSSMSCALPLLCVLVTTNLVLVKLCYKAICLLFIDVENVLSSTHFPSVLSGNSPLM